MAVRKTSTENTESVFLLLLKCIIVSLLSEKEGNTEGSSQGQGGTWCC